MDQCTYGALLRGAALDNDAVFEARAEAVCSMGVGCGTAGVCYAERMGYPEMCGRRDLSPKIRGSVSASISDQPDSASAMSLRSSSA